MKELNRKDFIKATIATATALVVCIFTELHAECREYYFIFKSNRIGQESLQINL